MLKAGYIWTMDALLLSLLLCLLAETYGKMPSLAGAFQVRYGTGVGSLACIFSVLAVVAALAAISGALITEMLIPEARSLFFACALGTAGATILLARPSMEETGQITTRSFPFAPVAMLAVGITEAAAFLIAGIAASRSDPWMAGIGGWLGMAMACFLNPLSRVRNIPQISRKAAQIGTAILLILVAFFIIVQALRLS